MLKRSKLNAILMGCTLLMLGCATPAVPVAVSCPKPPEPPAILTESASPAPPLIEDWTRLLDSFEAALRRSFDGAMKR